MAKFKKKETADQYETVGWVGGDKQVFGKFGTVDLQTVTPSQAESLVKRGFSKIRAKAAKAAAKTGGKKSD